MNNIKTSNTFSLNLQFVPKTLICVFCNLEVPELRGQASWPAEDLPAAQASEQIQIKRDK